MASLCFRLVSGLRCSRDLLRTTYRSLNSNAGRRITWAYSMKHFMAPSCFILGTSSGLFVAKRFYERKSINQIHLVEAVQAAGVIPDNSEKTFIMVKPDGVQRGLIGEIIKRFEQRGFQLVAMKFVQPTEVILKKHYKHLIDKPYFKGLVRYVASGPVVAMVWEGPEVVKTGRCMIGETDPAVSPPGTIRGDFCMQVGRTVVHGSDSIETSKDEISLWFNEEELIEWKSPTTIAMSLRNE